MGSGMKVSLMNDYERSVLDESIAPPAFLNGDTAVRSLLGVKQKAGQELLQGFDERYPDITEDMCVDDHRSESIYPRDAEELLYNPLPTDLPTVHKDLSILMSAYYGNIDRYVRLRRPVSMHMPGELACVIRGIYHNTMFAKYWSLQSDIPTWCKSTILKAVNARFIMCNDLSRVTTDTPQDELPYCIWYPGRASWKTYEGLARRCPAMVHQAAHACIVADYQKSFDLIDAPFDRVLLKEAQGSGNPHYLREMERKAALASVDLKDTQYSSDEWKCHLLQHTLFEKSGSRLLKGLGPEDMNTGWESIYSMMGPDASDIELNVCVPDDMRTADRPKLVEIDDFYDGL